MHLFSYFHTKVHHLGDQRLPRTNGATHHGGDWLEENHLSSDIISVNLSINPFDFSLAGREESDTDDQLLGDTDLDGPPPEMERLGVRWDPSDSCSLQSRLEAGHDSLQQVSHDSFFDDRKKETVGKNVERKWEEKKKKKKKKVVFRWTRCRKIEVLISINLPSLNNQLDLRFFCS